MTVTLSGPDLVIRDTALRAWALNFEILNFLLQRSSGNCLLRLKYSEEVSVAGAERGVRLKTSERSWLVRSRRVL